MHVADCEDNLGRIEACLVLRKPAKSAKMIKQLPSRTVIQHKVELVFGLECHLHPHDEWMIHIAQDAAFSFRMLDLVPSNDKVLPQDFECKNLPARLFLGQKHFAYKSEEYYDRVSSRIANNVDFL